MGEVVTLTRSPKLRFLTPTEAAFNDRIADALERLSHVDVVGAQALDPATSEPAREGRRTLAIQEATSVIADMRTIIGLLSEHPIEPEEAA